MCFDEELVLLFEGKFLVISFQGPYPHSLISYTDDLVVGVGNVFDFASVTSLSEGEFTCF